MLTTTPQLIHDRFVEVIEAIPITYVDRQGEQWRHVPDDDGLASDAEIRLFYMEEDIALAVDGGLWSPRGEEYEYELQVWVSYGTLGKRWQHLVTQDAVDLRIQLEQQLAPTLSGLLRVRHEDFEAEQDQVGHILGFHVFTIGYMHDTSQVP